MEYTKTGSDDQAAAMGDAAFNPDKTSPEEQMKTAGEGQGVGGFLFALEGGVVVRGAWRGGVLWVCFKGLEEWGGLSGEGVFASWRGCFKGTLRRSVADGCLRRRMSLIRWMSRPRTLRFRSRGMVRRGARGGRARVLGRRRVTGRGRVGRELRLRVGGLEGGT